MRTRSNPQLSVIEKIASFSFDLLLAILILIGLYLRFSWVNWNQGANLHPDEYGLTSTLTQLHLPDDFAAYFNTRLSPLSPYPKYDLQGQSIVDGPDNRMRWGQWPQILIRTAAELTGNTGYDQIRILGRRLSAAADALAILFIFLIGETLYEKRTGLLAAALSSLAVLQIQQSHFMTVDNFATLFATICLYICVRIAKQSPLYLANRATKEAPHSSAYRVDRCAWIWFALFGVTFGMALATKINLLPLGGMLLVATGIGVADLKLKTRQNLGQIIRRALLLLFFAAIVTAISFRLTQPMSFRALKGDTTLLTLHLNPDWVESMKVAQQESNGEIGGPPAQQWANRPAILYPLMNLMVWGMGLPLGIAAWASFLWILIGLLKNGQGWRAHLLPMIWVGGYFLFMGTRWVKSMRYFLPIYPFLALLAAWGLLELFKRLQKARSRSQFTLILPVLAIVIVLGGTFLWTWSFSRAIYQQTNTRVAATSWILHNIPTPVQLDFHTEAGISHLQFAMPDLQTISAAAPLLLPVTVGEAGNLTGITIPHADSSASTHLHLKLYDLASSPKTLLSLSLPVPGNSPNPRGDTLHADFDAISLVPGETYSLLLSTGSGPPVTIARAVIANEEWDEGLPFPSEGIDPFGQYYHGITNYVRRFDDPDKRQMFIDTLAQADYLILPSQRSIWSIDRIPLSYPMTLEYYRALFDGRLGFDLIASFNSPITIGPLYVSDLGGNMALNHPPHLPLFNFNPFAAEEAFSVYDHPPVWIFKKRVDFSQAKVQQVLEKVDLSKVVIQAPRDAMPLLVP
jgi:4-amino-4-deoxy-L-arabinose transferase-like glycosyltransferase